MEAKHKDSLLYTLPDELLTLITEELISSLLSYTEITPSLKTLRLVSRRLAYLKIIQASLFARVEFISDPIESVRLEHGDFERVSCFVKHVTFVPPLYNWHVDQKLLEIIHGRQSSAERSFDEAFESYQKAALACKTHLRSNRLKQRWASALRLARNCHSIQTIIVDYGSTGLDTRNNWPHPIIWPGEHHHLYEHRERTLVGDVGDEFFATVVSAVAEAQLEIHELDFNHPISGCQVWKQLPGWDHLNVSRLRELHVSPNILRVGSSSRYPGDADSADVGHSTAVLIQHGSRYLEAFGYVGITELPCVPQPATTMANLKTVELHACSSFALVLRDWINASPNLQSLIMSHLSLEEERQYGWRHVFDAIRQHKRGMHFCLDHVVVENRNGDPRYFNIDMHSHEGDLEKYAHTHFSIETGNGYQFFLADLKSKCPWFYGTYKNTSPEQVREYEGRPFLVNSPYTLDVRAVAVYVVSDIEWDEDLNSHFAGSGPTSS